MNGWKNEYSYVNALNLIWGRCGPAQQPIATPLSDPHPYPSTFQSALNLKEVQVSFSKHLFNLNNYILLGVGRWQKMTGRNSLSSCIKKTASLSLEETRGSKPGLCPTRVHGLPASIPHHHGRTIAPIPIAQMRRVRISPGLPSSASLPIFV